MKNKLPIIVAVTVVGVLILTGLFFILRGNKKTEEPTGKEATPTQGPISIEDRPFVNLTPRSDGHELFLEISNIRNTNSVEYELVYLVGDLQRGVIGSVDIKDEMNISRNLLLGSCSKNVCKYDEGVNGGILTLRFRGYGGTQKYEVPFGLNGPLAKKIELNSSDNKFNFQGNSTPGAFYVTGFTVGVPMQAGGKIIGGPYGIFTSGSTVVKGTVKINLDSSASQVKIFGWDSSTNSWKQYVGSLDSTGQTVSAEVDRLTTFVAVSY